MRPQAILLPGIVLPKELAYGALRDALGDGVDARAKDLEVYATDEPPAGYGLKKEIEGVLREADDAGFERFHLIGYSGGGAISIALVSRHPDRVLSLALLEPAWVGNEGMSEEERGLWAEFERIRDLPAEEMMPRVIRTQLAPGVEPPPLPPGPAPPWMAKRPAGIRALIAAFQRYHLDPGSLRASARPVYYALGARSNPDSFLRMGERLGELFPTTRSTSTRTVTTSIRRTGLSRNGSPRGCASSGYARQPMAPESGGRASIRSQSFLTPSSLRCHDLGAADPRLDRGVPGRVRVSPPRNCLQSAAFCARYLRFPKPVRWCFGTRGHNQRPSRR